MRLAARRKVDVLSLTDHDTVSGGEAAKREAERWGIRTIPGSEVSVEHAGQDLHILAYHLNPEDGAMLEMLAFIREGRVRRAAAMVAKLQELGLEIELSQVLARAENPDAVGRLHVAVALAEAGLVDRAQDAFRYYIGQGGPAYVGKETPKLEDVFEILRNAGAVLVLAHPGVYDLEPILDDLESAGLDGVEVWHPVHEPAKVQSLARLASEKGWVVTGGSDFHGGREDEVQPGTLPVGAEVVDALEARHRSR